MFCRKCRRWHFGDPKLKNFVGEHAPTPPQVWRDLQILSLHCWLLVSCFLTTQCLRIEEETWSRRGWGGCIWKIICYCQGGANFICNYLEAGGGGVKFWFTTLRKKGCNKQSVPKMEVAVSWYSNLIFLQFLAVVSAWLKHYLWLFYSLSIK